VTVTDAPLALGHGYQRANGTWGGPLGVFWRRQKGRIARNGAVTRGAFLPWFMTNQACRGTRVGAALKSGGSAQNESKFSVISSRRQPSGRRDGFRLTPLRMCSCGRGLARACLLVLPWSVCLGRPAESRARPGRAHSAAETAIPVALVVDFRALQVASNGLGASARSWYSRHVPPVIRCK
jgi:hypothetical protein